ncbi:MAG: hypothetical protein KGJ09_00585 [Candidatus Omnitrophica bacterium]|nr:hypothetical protein [Candidatus Omnitrophota bacterium]
MRKNGQSIIEYILIAILVILAIAFMGTYVLRSVNAHFKMWDEGVRDSAEEIINQAPIADVPNISLNCSCSQTVGTCGSSTPGSQCAANEKIITWNCNPQGCNGAQGNSTCELDPSCCNTPAPQGCGNHPLPFVPATKGYIGTPMPCPTGLSGTCYQGLGSGSPCYYGQQTYGYACGSNTSQVCVPDNSCPNPTCTGFILFSNSTTYCPGATSGLLQDTPNYYVGNNSSACSGSGNCELYCNAPYSVTPANPTNPTEASCSMEFNVAASCCGPDGYDPSCQYSTNNTSNPTCANGGCSCWASGSHQITNNESFSVCLDPTTKLSSVYALPVGSTATNTYKSPALSPTDGGCGDPGLPSQTCSISVNFGS